VCQILDLTAGLSATLKFTCQQFIYGHYEEITNTEFYNALPKPLRDEMIQNYNTFKDETVTSFLNQTSTEELAEYMRAQIVSFLAKNIKGFSINEALSSEGDTPIGPVSYKLSNFTLSPVMARQLVREKDVQVDFSTQNLEIAIFVNDIGVQMKDVHWEYMQKTFPNLEDEGCTDALFEGMELKILFRIVPHQIGVPQLSLKKLDVQIANFRLELHSGKYTWLYNLFLDTFQKKIKSIIEKEVSSKLRDALNTLTNTLNAMGTSDYVQV